MKRQSRVARRIRFIGGMEDSVPSEFLFESFMFPPNRRTASERADGTENERVSETVPAAAAAANQTVGRPASSEETSERTAIRQALVFAVDRE